MVSINVEIVSIESVRASTYNPRKADPVRLDLVELSLRKLGFLSPIYADVDGEILSGHQRHHVATRMRLTHVPVCRLPAMGLEQRKALNIVFNRATNDMDAWTTSETVSMELRRANVRRLGDALPDFEGVHRCVNVHRIATKDVLSANYGGWIDYAAAIARTLRARGVTIPIVCTRNNVVVNGIGRLQVAAEKGDSTVPVVYIEDHEAEFARSMLNFLSMDFDLHNRYADTLRYGSFRRPMTTRAGLGRGFFVERFGEKTSKEFDLTDPMTASRWRRVYGKTIVDFGAGRFTDTEILRKIGVDVTPFEPYPCLTGKEPDKALGIEVSRSFLATVASGKRFDAVFISSVLNSVPFRADREHIATIAAALCGDDGTLYAWTMSTGSISWTGLSTVNRNERISSASKFRLDYESGITIGDVGNAPKVQKYHEPSELYDVFRGSFSAVQVRRFGQDLSVVARGPAYTNEQLSDALAFEFDLPYSDGTRMGLVDEAMAAFRARGCFR